MSLIDYLLTEASFTGNEIEGLDDEPTLTAEQLKDMFDAGSKNVIMPAVNGIINTLNAPPTIRHITSWSQNIGPYYGQNAIAWEDERNVYINLNFISTLSSNSIPSPYGICTLPVDITRPSVPLSFRRTACTMTATIGARYEIDTGGMITVAADINGYYGGSATLIYPKGI